MEQTNSLKMTSKFRAIIVIECSYSDEGYTTNSAYFKTFKGAEAWLNKQVEESTSTVHELTIERVTDIWEFEKDS